MVGKFHQNRYQESNYRSTFSMILAPNLYTRRLALGLFLALKVNIDVCSDFGIVVLPFWHQQSGNIASWRRLGASWRRMGSSWRHLGASKRCLGES